MENKENNNLEMPIPAQQEQQADFSSIFNVASEEIKEEKKEVPKPKAEEKETSTSPLPEDNKNPNREKNTFAFNSEERVLYEIKPEKESSPIVPLLFFAVLISEFLIKYKVVIKNKKKENLPGEEVDAKC